jgi:pimeloyl-ACP methyl ester carboxylesterase
VSVVYLHPVGLDGEVWRRVAEPGGLTPSFPGFGDTPLTGEPTFDRLVEFVAGIVSEQGPADLVGLSLGSMVAQHVAVERPELVRSLVLACGGMSAHPEVMRDRAETTRRVGMSGVLQTTLERWFTPAALTRADHPGVTYARRRLLSDSADVFAAYWAAMGAHDLTDELKRIDVPATVVAGAQDESVPVTAMREVADRIEGARFEVLDGPHILPLENPDGFARLVREHLARVEG